MGAKHKKERDYNPDMPPSAWSAAGPGPIPNTTLVFCTIGRGRVYAIIADNDKKVLGMAFVPLLR